MMQELSSDNLLTESTKEEVNSDGQTETDLLVISETANKMGTERKSSQTETFMTEISPMEEWNHKDPTPTNLANTTMVH